jgi:hypothetical protein
MRTAHRKSMTSRAAAVAFVSLVGSLVISGSIANAQVTLTSPTTEVTVFGGSAENGLTNSGGYFDYEIRSESLLTTYSIDPVLIAPTGEVFVLSNGLLSTPGGSGEGAAPNTQSSAEVGPYLILAETTLVGDVAVSNFRIQAATGAGLTGAKFVFYAENDLPTLSTNRASFSGSVSDEGVVLRQRTDPSADQDVVVELFDRLVPSLTDGGPTGIRPSQFASGQFNGFGTRITNGDLSDFSADGSTFNPGPADLGLGLLYDLSGDDVVISIGYRGEFIPEPALLGTLAGASALLLRRRVK